MTYWKLLLRGLGFKDLNEHPCSGGGVRFSHNVLNVFFDRLFGNIQRIRYFLIGPSFSEILDHRLLPIGQLKSFLGLVSIELLSTTQLF